MLGLSCISAWDRIGGLGFGLNMKIGVCHLAVPANFMKRCWLHV